MRIDDINEAPMGMLNRMTQKVVSKVPGNMGLQAQGKLETGKVANQWKRDYMKYLGRVGQKPDTENLKAFLKSLGMADQDAVSIVGESALIERALTGKEIDNAILKAAQKGAGQVGLGSAPSTASPAAPKTSFVKRAGQKVKGFASKASDAIGQTFSKPAATQNRIEPTLTTQTPPAAAKSAPGSDIDTYINNWAKNINAAATTQEKINLAKEVIGFLKDRKGSPEGKRGVIMAKSVLKRQNDPTLQKIMKSGAFALERKIYAAVNKLLESIELTWKDLGYRVSISESTSDYVVIVKR
jgi:ribosomal protein L12E/L44/L45/RPP1/RPP2